MQALRYSPRSWAATAALLLCIFASVSSIGAQNTLAAVQVAGSAQQDTHAAPETPHYVLADAVPHAAEDMPHEAVDLADASTRGGGDMDLESMLHWAISHSDPEVLRKNAETAIKEEALASLKERRARVRELIDVMNQQPTEAGLIKEALDILTHPDSDSEHQLKALAALQILVEPIDNANDLKGMGGLKPVMAGLQSSHPDVQAAAAYVIGTAASNNPKFQEHLTADHPEVFQQLIQLITTGRGEVVVKGLYAAAALVRNLSPLRQTFLSQGGLEAVRQVLAPTDSQAAGRPEARAQRKALALLIDLVHLDEGIARTCLDKGLVAPVSDMLQHPDTDLQEKALDVIKTLVRYSTQAASAFLEAGTDRHAERIHGELVQHLMASAGDMDDHYTKYLLGMVQEVQAALKTAKNQADRLEL